MRGSARRFSRLLAFPLSGSISCLPLRGPTMFHWSCAEIQVVIRRSRPPLSSVYVSVRDGASQHKKQLLGNFPPSLLFPYVYIFLLQRLPTPLNFRWILPDAQRPSTHPRPSHACRIAAAPIFPRAAHPCCGSMLLVHTTNTPTPTRSQPWRLN